jgi:hypothetical protein
MPGGKYWLRDKKRRLAFDKFGEVVNFGIVDTAGSGQRDWLV